MADAFPTIPAEEYRQRWSRLQEKMSGERLDLLIAYADDRAVSGPAHARWLANFPVHFEPACILVLPFGEPLLLCGPESDQYARLAGQIADVRVLRELTHPDEDYPFTAIQGLAEVVTAGLPGRLQRAGLAGRSLMSAGLLAAFEQALPGVEWVEAEHLLYDLRAVKTPAEVEVVRQAYRIAEAGLLAGYEAIRPGASEREVAAEIDAAMRRAGAEGSGIDTIVASGPNSRPILARSTFRRIQPDDLVLLTVAPRYEGYHAAIGRPVLVGDPGPAPRQALQAAVAAQQACARALAPGVEGRQVEAIGRRLVAAAGLGQHFLYSGLHSVGVIEFEPPIFGPSSPARLQQDMIISIDIPIFNAPWGGLRVEDGYRITAQGAERLEDIPFVLKK